MPGIEQGSEGVAAEVAEVAKVPLQKVILRLHVDEVVCCIGSVEWGQVKTSRGLTNWECLCGLRLSVSPGALLATVAVQEFVQ